MSGKLTQDHLKEILHYNPETGIFTWIVNFKNGVHVGDAAGQITNNGYRSIRYKGKIYLAHRLAWFYMKGVWVPEIDHRDTNKLNNIWTNLREATRQQNQYNKNLGKNNTSGVKGVIWHKRDNVWCAVIKINGKLKNIGSFRYKEDAIKARQEYALNLHKEYARETCV